MRHYPLNIKQFFSWLHFFCCTPPFRRCSSYQDFTKLGGSSESVDLPRPPSDGEGPSQKHRHISRTLSEPSQLTGGRMGTSHSEHRGRRSVRQRNSRLSSHLCVRKAHIKIPVVYLREKNHLRHVPALACCSAFSSNRTPSPPDFNRRGACGPNQEEDCVPGRNTPQTELMGTASLTSRGQLGSRPHTPVRRVDIRPHDDPVMVPPTLYYTPASPKLEFKSIPNSPVTERWLNLSKVRIVWFVLIRKYTPRAWVQQYILLIIVF